MARKLSPIARRATALAFSGIALLVATRTLAQEDAQLAAQPRIIENPAAVGQAQQKPPIAAEALPTSPRRATLAYQNPFAAMSKSPPVDTSLRPGPISRWRPPVFPTDETSVVKSAVLSTQATNRNETWDQLPPAENLKFHAASGTDDNDSAFYARLASSTGTVQFSPKPLTQPLWLSAATDEPFVCGLNPLQAAHATFDASAFDGGFAKQAVALSDGPGPDGMNQIAITSGVGPLDAALARSDMSPMIIGDSAGSSEGWLEKAQHAAAGAGTPKELTAVIELCERGTGNETEGKSSSSRRLAAWAHNRRGELYADAERTEDALNDFQSAITLDPNCSLAIHNRAVTLAQQNEFAAALRDFNRVIELNPGLSVAYRNRAELLATLGRLDEAVADYNQAIDNLPKNPQLFRGRAYAYQRVGKFREALADLNRSIEMSPNDPDAFTQRGNLDAEQGNFEQAVADFRQAISKDPSWAEAHRSLAWLEATCPNSHFLNARHAMVEAEQAAQLAPANDYLTLDTLAAAHASTGQFDKAIEIQQKALANAPSEAASSLQQRLDLYRNGRPYRTVATPIGNRGSSDVSSSRPSPPRASAQ
jgi:tetratricopeptide (TPR) repeat protein